MKVCNVNRNAFYVLLDAIFVHLKIAPSIVELGVLRGDNASAMLAALKPEKLVLIDAWSAAAMRGAFHPFEQTPPWIAPIQLLEPYYGGDMHEQATFDRIFEQCVARFAGNDKVEITAATLLPFWSSLAPPAATKLSILCMSTRIIATNMCCANCFVGRIAWPSTARWSSMIAAIARVRYN